MTIIVHMYVTHLSRGFKPVTCVCVCACMCVCACVYVLCVRACVYACVCACGDHAAAAAAGHKALTSGGYILSFSSGTQP